MNRSFRAGVAIAVLTASVPLLAPAQQPDDAVMRAAIDAAFAIMEIEGFVDANGAFCAAAAPETAEEVGRAVDQWHAVNATRFLWRWIEAQPELSASFTTARMQRGAEIGAAVAGRSAGRETEWCWNLPALLTEAQWDVAASYAPEVAAIQSLGASMADEAALPLQRGQALEAIPATALADAVAVGWDPDAMPLPGEYRCYDESADTVDHADLIVQITGPGTYASSFGGGLWGMQDDEIVWTSGPLRDVDADASLGYHGAELSFDSVARNGRGTGYECRQTGASETELVVSARLVTPQVGIYSCTDAEGTAESFEILPGREYRFGTGTGAYGLSGVIGRSSASIDWITGPFAGERSSYSEEEGTGLREFTISTNGGRAIGGFVYSSSELALSCEGRGEPVSRALYGPDPAPAPPAGAQVLDGRYVRDVPRYTGTFTAYEPEIYTFHPDGYVYVGAPDPGTADDCARTKPNGLPVCQIYRIDGDQLTIARGSGDDEYDFALEDGVPVLDGDAMTAVEPSTDPQLEGNFWANYYSGMGFCGPYSSCSSTYIEWNYAFSADGRFVYSTDSQSLASMNTAIASTSYGSNGSDSDRGAYAIDGNTITFRYDNGITRSYFFMRDGPTAFLVSDRRYTLKDDSQ